MTTVKYRVIFIVMKNESDKNPMDKIPVSYDIKTKCKAIRLLSYDIKITYTYIGCHAYT